LKATARAAPDQGRAPAELYTERGAEAPSGAGSQSKGYNRTHHAIHLPPLSSP
jgi:hypothetical protein